MTKSKKSFLNKLWNKYVNWIINIQKPFSSRAFKLGYSLRRFNKPFYFVYDNFDIILSIICDTFSLVFILTGIILIMNKFSILNIFAKFIFIIGFLNIIVILGYTFYNRIR